MPEDLGSAGLVPMYKDKGEENEWKNYTAIISLLSVAGKIYPGVRVDRVLRVTEGLINDEQKGFQSREVVCISSLHSKEVW